MKEGWSTYFEIQVDLQKVLMNWNFFADPLGVAKICDIFSKWIKEVAICDTLMLRMEHQKITPVVLT